MLLSVYRASPPRITCLPRMLTLTPRTIKMDTCMLAPRAFGAQPTQACHHHFFVTGQPAARKFKSRSCERCRYGTRVSVFGSAARSALPDGLAAAQDDSSMIAGSIEAQARNTADAKKQSAP